MSANLDVKKQIDTVFSIANTLRGTYQPDKYRDVIIPMVILRRVECALAETKNAVCEAYEANPSIADAMLRRKSGYAFYNTSRWTLAKLLGNRRSCTRICLRTSTRSHPTSSRYSPTWNSTKR